MDVEDGAPILKLCMNNGDNPHLVAERFLIENRLPTSYLDQVLGCCFSNILYGFEISWFESHRNVF